MIYALLVAVGGHSSATVTQITDPSRCSREMAGCWEIDGVISDADQRQVAAIADRLAGSKRTPFFWLNSSGGDVEAAIAIGRQLRRIGATAMMWDEAKCLSSCVFVLAGATRRVLVGKIGIHRPYALRTDQRTYDSVQMEQRRLAKLAKEYLEEMNVSPLLYDAMVRVPPEQIRLLSRSDLERFGITETDIVEHEVHDAGEARKYGLSKTEYLRRKSQADISCKGELERGKADGNFNSYFACRTSILSAPK